MDKRAYLLHLRELLEAQYQKFKEVPAKSLLKNERIEGFMEVGLISGMGSRSELVLIINQAHKSVFWASFDYRGESLNNYQKEIPAWIRKGVKLDLDHDG